MSRPKSNRSRLLELAAQAVDGPRNAQYGDPIQDFLRTAGFWQLYLAGIIEKRGSLELLPHDVAAMMSLLKVSRITWSPEVEDHWMDLAGYAACGFDCTQRQRQQED